MRESTIFPRLPNEVARIIFTFLNWQTLLAAKMVNTLWVIEANYHLKDINYEAAGLGELIVKTLRNYYVSDASDMLPHYDMPRRKRHMACEALMTTCKKYEKAIQIILNRKQESWLLFSKETLNKIKFSEELYRLNLLLYTEIKTFMFPGRFNDVYKKMLSFLYVTEWYEKKFNKNPFLNSAVGLEFVSTFNSNERLYKNLLFFKREEAFVVAFEPKIQKKEHASLTNRLTRWIIS